MREVGRDGDGGRRSKGTPAPLACVPAVLAVSSLAAFILDEESAHPRAPGARTSAHGARTHWVPVRTHTIRARARADTRASAPLVSGEGRRCA